MALGRWAGTLAALTLGGGGWLAFGQPGTLPAMVQAAQPSTPLEIEIVGGFAIVQADPRLDIVYLNNPMIKLSDTRPLTTGESDPVVCNVPQIGTQLEVVRGKIINANPPNAPELPSKIFDLDKKEVTFQALEAGAGPPGTPPVHTWPPVPPLPTPFSNAAQWHNLRFIPGLTKRHTGTGPAPNWFNKVNTVTRDRIVNGRIRLRGGSITGDVPSRPQMQESHFEFRERSNSVLPVKAAVTDRAVYSATVVGNSVTIEFSPGGNSPIRSLVVAPLVAGEAVKLRVRGHHNGLGPEPGGKLGDFCAFYALFNDIPDYEKWLEPFLIQAVGGGGGGLAQPTPGFYCPMDWF